jgi:hypothetical protein
MTFIRAVYDAERVVKYGTWLYAGETTCDVRIVYSRICFGSGDDDDPIEMRQDVKRDTFYVEYGSITDRGLFNGGGGAFASVHEAMRHAEAALPGVKWIA